MAKTKEKMELYAKICEKAEQKGYKGQRITLMMDLESADERFNLRLEEMLADDGYDFVHDINGIIQNADRESFPASFGFFVPRYAGKYGENAE